MKRLHQTNGGEHAIARLRKIIGDRYKYEQVDEAIGIPLNTFKSVTSGRLRLGEGLAKRISEYTGVSATCLLDNGTKLITQSGKAFTLKIYLNHRAQQEGIETEFRKTHVAFSGCLAWQRILTIKINRVLIAAMAEKEPALAFYNLLKAIGGVGREYPQWENLKRWDEDLQGAVGEKMGKGGMDSRRRKAMKIWREFENRLLHAYNLLKNPGSK